MLFYTTPSIGKKTQPVHQTNLFEFLLLISDCLDLVLQYFPFVIPSHSHRFDDVPSSVLHNRRHFLQSGQSVNSHQEKEYPLSFPPFNPLLSNNSIAQYDYPLSCSTQRLLSDLFSHAPLRTVQRIRRRKLERSHFIHDSERKSADLIFSFFLSIFKL